jgi:hypothetical protein
MNSKKAQPKAESPKDQLSGVARSTHDVPVGQAAGMDYETNPVVTYAVKPLSGNGGGTAGAGWDITSPKGA